MAPNTTVVEIHGALKYDFDMPTDWMYCRLARRLGLRWAGFAPDGFRPVLVTNKTRGNPWAYPKIGGVSTRSVAFVNADLFSRFFRRVMVAHESGYFDVLTQEYKERVEAHQDPGTLLKLRPK